MRSNGKNPELSSEEVLKELLPPKPASKLSISSAERPA